MSAWHWFAVLTVIVLILGGLAFLAAFCFLVWDDEDHRGVDL